MNTSSPKAFLAFFILICPVLLFGQVLPDSLKLLSYDALNKKFKQHPEKQKKRRILYKY